MIGLTIRQLWASMIVDGVKRYEFRDQSTDHRGLFLVRSGAAYEDAVYSLAPRDKTKDPLRAILGVARLVDVIRITEENVANLSAGLPRSPTIGGYAWVLESPRQLCRPIPFEPKPGAVKWFHTELDLAHVEFIDPTARRTLVC